MNKSIAAAERHLAVLLHERGEVGERPPLDAVEVSVVVRCAPARKATGDHGVHRGVRTNIQIELRTRPSIPVRQHATRHGPQRPLRSLRDRMLDDSRCNKRLERCAVGRVRSQRLYG